MVLTAAVVAVSWPLMTACSRGADMDRYLLDRLEPAKSGPRAPCLLLRSGRPPCLAATRGSGRDATAFGHVVKRRGGARKRPRRYTRSAGAVRTKAGAGGRRHGSPR